MACLLAIGSARAAPAYRYLQSSTAGEFSPDASAADLINTGAATLSGVPLLPRHDTNWSSGHLTDGFTSTTNNNGGTNGNCFLNSAILSGAENVAVFDLNTGLSPAGYRIDSIQSIAGFPQWNTMQANQKFEVWTRAVGGGDYELKAVADFSPFTDPNAGPGETKVTISDDAGPLATGVESIRFVFLPAVQNGGIAPGTVYREIDVQGYALTTPPAGTTSPVPRQIVQRNTAGMGAIPISGTYAGTPEAIEARAVVMAGTGNNGVSTAWQTIAAAPAGGNYSGQLSPVPQGGWYQVEVRAIVGGQAQPATIIDKVGVGDVYIVAGQSNSANWGSPAAAAANDRVSALHSGTGGWSLATDPLPYADGTGGSAWTRLGDMLAAERGVPVGFACVGVGGTAVSEWSPAGGSLYPRLSAALSRFPPGGFKAILWHQGESDSLRGTTSSGMAATLAAIIARTRSDDGWSIPWFISEASFHPDSTGAMEELVAAGQRLAAGSDPLVFRGAATDDFHLTGKLSDIVHFNAAGLQDHARQWQRVLGGNAPVQVLNASFNENGSLPDGGIFFSNGNVAASPRPVGWRVLNPDGESFTSAAAGYYNPDASFYSNAADSVNGGILPGMDDKHCGYIYSGVPGCHFLQTIEATVQPSTRYQLTVAVGIRSAAAEFGGLRIELLADGTVLQSAEIPDKGTMDSLRGSDSSGVFTDVALSYDSPVNPVAGQSLAVRLTKPGGSATYADFDRIRLSATPLTATDPKSAIIDFSDAGVGVSFGAIAQTYQPLQAPLGITIGYQNIGVYNGGPDHSTNDTAGANFNSFQNRPEGGYTEPSVTPQIFTFSEPVTIRSLWLSTFQGGPGLIRISAFEDEAGSIPAGPVQTVTPSGGVNPIQWVQFTAFATPPYSDRVRRIEFVSEEPEGANSFMSNIQVDDIHVSKAPSLSAYAQWTRSFWGNPAAPEASPAVDVDGDGLPNGVEFHMGTSPILVTPFPSVSLVTHSGRDWARMNLPLDPSVDHTGLAISGSSDLISWQPVGSIADGSVQLTTSASLWTAEADRLRLPHYFFKISATITP